MPSPLENLRRRRRAREMMRRLEELDRLDAAYGVGTDPYAPVPPAGTPVPRTRRTTVLVVVVLALCLVGATGALWSRPGPTAADPEGYAFLATLDTAGTPVRWDSCEPIRYVVNPAGAPPGWQDLLDTGVAHVEAATGLDLEQVGTTDDRSFLERPAGAPVLVGWADEDEVPGLEGDVAGLAGPTSAATPGRVREYAGGMVVLDSDAFDRLLPGRERSAQAVVDHELAHLVGLGHVDDPDQLMHPESSRAREYAAGDLAGLRELGRGECTG